MLEIGLYKKKIPSVNRKLAVHRGYYLWAITPAVP